MYDQSIFELFKFLCNYINILDLICHVITKNFFYKTKKEEKFIVGV